MLDHLAENRDFAYLMNSSSLYELYEVLKTRQFVDLTHTFKPGIPHWPGFPDEKRETIYSYESSPSAASASGFFAEVYTHVGQWGTHIDAPVHFSKGLRTVDQIDVKEMILPLVVIDVHQQVADNPDYVISMNDVLEWEWRNGKVPENAFVAMRTDWHKRWPDIHAMQNRDEQGVFHYPGWSLEVLRYLYETRHITASGHEPVDADPGMNACQHDYSLEAYILSTDHFQLEMLANLDKVPEAGALLVVSWPKPCGGSGFPARVFAILP